MGDLEEFIAMQRDILSLMAKSIKLVSKKIDHPADSLEHHIWNGYMVHADDVQRSLANMVKEINKVL